MVAALPHLGFRSGNPLHIAQSEMGRNINVGREIDPLVSLVGSVCGWVGSQRSAGPCTAKTECDTLLSNATRFLPEFYCSGDGRLSKYSVRTAVSKECGFGGSSNVLCRPEKQ